MEVKGRRCNRFLFSILTNWIYLTANHMSSLEGGDLEFLFSLFNSWRISEMMYLFLVETDSAE